VVNYDVENWKLLSEHLLKPESNEGPASVSPSTRAKLLHDALNLAFSGELDFATALSMTRFLKYEKRFEPWHPFFNMIELLLKKLDGSTVGKKLAVST
jgi:aminopeptidase N